VPADAALNHRPEATKKYRTQSPRRKAREIAAAGFPTDCVRQPQPFDLVDDPAAVSGAGTGFEATFQARVRDDTGARLASITIMAGATGIWATSTSLRRSAACRRRPRERWRCSRSRRRTGARSTRSSLPFTFGRALLNRCHGFAQHTAVDTLAGIPLRWYGDATPWPRLYEANRHQITKPNLILVGQVLRVPQ